VLGPKTAQTFLSPKPDFLHEN